MASEPAARVRAFIDDWYARWGATAPVFEASDQESGEARGDAQVDAFEVWRSALQGVAERHGVPGVLALPDSSFGPPVHTPDEQIVAERVTGDSAVVQTVRRDELLDEHFEYDLRRLDDDWRIERVVEYLDDPDDPILPPEALRDALAGTSPDAPFAALHPVEAELDHGSLFVPRDITDEAGETSRLQVQRVGTFRCASGVLAAFDLGYPDISPFLRAVPPGDYAVETSTAFGRNAAVRVVLGPGEPIAWRPAERLEGGHGVGVDAGNVAIVDLAALGSVTVRDRERAFAPLAVTQGPFARMLTFGGETPVGAVVESGWGDGSYFAFWGFDETGALVQLVVDFMLAATMDDPEPIDLPWGAFDDPTLEGWSLTVGLEGSPLRLVVDDPHNELAEVALLDAAGDPVPGFDADEHELDEDDRMHYALPGGSRDGWLVRLLPSTGVLRLR